MQAASPACETRVTPDTVEDVLVAEGGETDVPEYLPEETVDDVAQTPVIPQTPQEEVAETPNIPPMAPPSEGLPAATADEELICPSRSRSHSPVMRGRSLVPADPSCIGTRTQDSPKACLIRRHCREIDANWVHGFVSLASSGDTTAAFLQGSQEAFDKERCCPLYMRQPREGIKGMSAF
eukprot:3278420-Amphidinium_carterae.1